MTCSSTRAPTPTSPAAFPDSAFAETVRRADAYLAAGASGIFVPGVQDLHVLHDLSRRIAAPLNALAGLGAPSVGELHDAGVRRISIGGNTAKAAYATVSRVAEDVLGDGNWSELAGARSHAAHGRSVPAGLTFD